MHKILGQDKNAKKVLKFKNYLIGSATCSMCIKHLRVELCDADPLFIRMFQENVAFVGHLYWYLVQALNNCVDPFYESFFWLMFFFDIGVVFEGKQVFFLVSSTLCQFWREKSVNKFERVFFLHVKDQNTLIIERNFTSKKKTGQPVGTRGIQYSAVQKL